MMTRVTSIEGNLHLHLIMPIHLFISISYLYTPRHIPICVMPPTSPKGNPLRSSVTQVTRFLAFSGTRGSRSFGHLAVLRTGFSHKARFRWVTQKNWWFLRSTWGWIQLPMKYIEIPYLGLFTSINHGFLSFLLEGFLHSTPGWTQHLAEKVEFLKG